MAVRSPTSRAGQDSQDCRAKPNRRVEVMPLNSFISTSNKYSDSPGDCPDANFAGSGCNQGRGAGVGGRARGENIVYYHDPLSVEFNPWSHLEGGRNVF
jgi:hypothetical protein